MRMEVQHHWRSSPLDLPDDAGVEAMQKRDVDDVWPPRGENLVKRTVRYGGIDWEPDWIKSSRGKPEDRHTS
jgi:hypothetical protein